jgi:hypothetical protein
MSSACFLCPLVVGRGKRLFEESAGEVRLRLTDSRALKTGAVALSCAHEDS